MSTSLSRINLSQLATLLEKNAFEANILGDKSQVCAEIRIFNQISGEIDDGQAPTASRDLISATLEYFVVLSQW